MEKYSYFQQFIWKEQVFLCMAKGQNNITTFSLNKLNESH